MIEEQSGLNHDFTVLAERANRAMRTFNARNTAEACYALVQEALMSPESADAESRVLNALSKEHGWTRKNDREFLCTFGDRSCTLTVPRPFDRIQLTRLITRVQLNVFHGGGTDHTLMQDLQLLAQRELQRLFDSERET